MPAITLKLDEDLQQRLGVSNATEARAKLDELISAADRLPAAEANVGVAQAMVDERIAGLEARLNAVERQIQDYEAGLLLKLDASARPEIVRDATAKANELVVNSLGRSGVNPLANSNPVVDEQVSTGSANLIAEGKFEDAWHADAKLQKEFPDAKSYAFYAQAERDGRARISSRTTPANTQTN